MCFFPIFKIYFRLLTFLCFPSVSVCVYTHTRQVEHQRCSRTGRVQKNHQILKKSTIFNEHPVSSAWVNKQIGHMTFRCILQMWRNALSGRYASKNALCGCKWILKPSSTLNSESNYFNLKTASTSWHHSHVMTWQLNHFKGTLHTIIST